MASEEDNKQNDVVSSELSAPPGWTKKLIPKKTNTPQKNDIAFISPTGEEIKSKRQLDQYLKSHPGGPAASEFDWGTGDTPRRSARLGEKSKAVAPPPSETTPKKKPRKSSKKGAQEKTNADEEEDKAADDKDADAEETKEETEEAVEKSTEDAKDAMDAEANTEDKEKKTETEACLEEPSDAGKGDATIDNTNASVEKPSDATVAGDAKIDKSKESKIDESKEACTEVPGAENDVLKGSPLGGEEAAGGKAENNAEEKQAAENAGETDSALQGATIGS